MNKIIDNIGWNFDNSYINLPKILMTRVKPVKVKSPKLIIKNNELAENLNLSINTYTDGGSLCNSGS